MFQQLKGQICVEEGDKKVDYHIQNGFLYKLDKLYAPKGEILQLIIEADNSKVVGHFWCWEDNFQLTKVCVLIQNERICSSI